MTDRDKVVQKLEEVIADAVYPDRPRKFMMPLELAEDALALLKAQEPRLVTESDFDGADEYGYIPVWTEEKDGDMYWECIPKVAITDPDGIQVLRYWTSRPDQATREAVKWE